MTRAALFAAAFAIASAGCSHNPGYFPYLIPGGPIVENHAKPGGPGYFRNFDPKACKLEVTPGQQITAPVGTQVVLVGSVLDSEGQPRRSRRVEWLLDGPIGNIIEADESGVFLGRGYKVDNKYAVTYTNYVTKTITRGNKDPGDDVCIAPGQTFCVISSAVPGETVVTAYAPEVFNWDNGRVVVKICWGDGRFSYPQPAVVRTGGEHTLRTTVATTAAEGVPSGYRIRYTVIDGPPAVLVSKSGSGTGASQSGSGSKETETFTDANGEAAVQLVQPKAVVGKSRIAIEIVKPSETGTGQGTVVGRKETIVEWADPRMHLAVNAPTGAGLNGTFPVTVSLENDSAVDSRDAQVKISLSDGATLAQSEPPPISQDAAGTLLFTIPPVSGKAKQEVVLQVKPARFGQVSVTATASTSDGLQATQRATTRIDQGKLELHVEAPSAALAGEQIPFKLAVTNTGVVPAENATLWVKVDDGSKGAATQNPTELSAGSIAPGQTKVVDFPLTARQAGRVGVRASVTADGGLTASSDPVALDVRKAELAASVTGPKLVYLTQDFDWTVTVANRGEASVANVVVRATLPAEVRVKSAGDGKVGAGSIEWKFAELKSGEQRTLKVTAEAAKLNDKATLSVAVLADATNGSRTVGDPVGAKADSTVAIIGTPALALELATPPGLVDVGKRASFQVRVKNQGTVSARKVDVTAFAPPELKAIRGYRPIPGSQQPSEARIDGTGKIVFPTVDELKPGETLTFTIDVEAAQAGDARFRAEVQAAHLNNTLKEEQSTRVTGK
jgi:uncharacterized repeat protein (TIGR01451 family)